MQDGRDVVRAGDVNAGLCDPCGILTVVGVEKSAVHHLAATPCAHVPGAPSEVLIIRPIKVERLIRRAVLEMHRERFAVVRRRLVKGDDIAIGVFLDGMDEGWNVVLRDPVVVIDKSDEVAEGGVEQ